MGSNNQLKSLNDIFVERYAEALKDMIPEGSILHRMRDYTNYAKMSIETLEYRVNRYEDEEAKKELKKRSTPLWKVLNGV